MLLINYLLIYIIIFLLFFFHSNSYIEYGIKLITMNSVIFWLQLTFLTNLLAKVFTVSVTIDMDTYGTPMWIMTNTSDRRPKESDGGNFNEVQPFINWNGVLKMVKKNSSH